MFKMEDSAMHEFDDVLWAMKRGRGACTDAKQCNAIHSPRTQTLGINLAVPPLPLHHQPIYLRLRLQHGFCVVAGPRYAQLAHVKIHSAGRQRNPLVDRTDARRNTTIWRSSPGCTQGWCYSVQTRQPSSACSGTQVQEICYALCPDGKHLTFPARL